MALALCATVSIQSFFITEIQTQTGEEKLPVTESSDENTQSYDTAKPTPTTLIKTIELPWDSGAWGSVVAVLLGAFGRSASKLLTSATTAIEFGSYL